MLGENRVQEAADKIPATSGAHVAPHRPAPVQQGGPRRRAVRRRSSRSTASALAQRLDRLAGERRPGRPLPVLLQVNVADDPSKAGFSPAGVARDLAAILALPNLRVDGLMTIGPLVASADAARPTFVALRGCRRSSAARTRGSAPRCRWA